MRRSQIVMTWSLGSTEHDLAHRREVGILVSLCRVDMGSKLGSSAKMYLRFSSTTGRILGCLDIPLQGILKESCAGQAA
jgi:hypothetical protein